MACSESDPATPGRDSVPPPPRSTEQQNQLLDELLLEVAILEDDLAHYEKLEAMLRDRYLINVGPVREGLIHCTVRLQTRLTWISETEPMTDRELDNSFKAEVCAHYTSLARQVAEKLKVADYLTMNRVFDRMKSQYQNGRYALVLSTWWGTEYLKPDGKAAFRPMRRMHTLLSKMNSLADRAEREFGRARRGK